MNISVLILTKNEEQDLPDCLRSVSWSDDVHVFDSFSSDRTVDVAESFGARVTQRHFDNYAAHRNAALRTLRFKYRWLLMLDADERIPASLLPELNNFLTSRSTSYCAARLRRRDYFNNTWLRFSQISPYFIRLVIPDSVHFEREINEVLIPDGLVAELDGYFNHFPFSKGVTHWVSKHNQYSTMEAVRALNERGRSTTFSLQLALFSRDFNIRRYHQKGLYYRLPLRPIIKLFYMLFVRLAFLDGIAGIQYTLLQGIYEYLIVLKEKELDSNVLGAVAPSSHDE